jgi:hypothetical protein
MFKYYERMRIDFLMLLDKNFLGTFYRVNLILYSYIRYSIKIMYFIIDIKYIVHIMIKIIFFKI